jgi:hypothetical protein
MEAAYAVRDFEAYAQARTDFDNAATELKGVRGLFKGEEQVTPINPFRFYGEIDIKPAEYNREPGGVSHTIRVQAATRAEVYDRLIEESYNFVTGLRKKRQKLGLAPGDHYTMTMQTPDLNGKADSDVNSSGGTFDTLKDLVRRVNNSREISVEYYNRHLLSGKVYNNEATEAEKKAYYAIGNVRVPYGAKDEDFLKSEYSAAGTVFNHETDEERDKRITGERQVNERIRQSRRWEAAAASRASNKAEKVKQKQQAKAVKAKAVNVGGRGGGTVNNDSDTVDEIARQSLWASIFSSNSETPHHDHGSQSSDGGGGFFSGFSDFFSGGDSSSGGYDGGSSDSGGGGGSD